MPAPLGNDEGMPGINVQVRLLKWRIEHDADTTLKYRKHLVATWVTFPVTAVYRRGIAEDADADDPVRLHATTFAEWNQLQGGTGLQDCQCASQEKGFSSGIGSVFMVLFPVCGRYPRTRWRSTEAGH